MAPSCQDLSQTSQPSFASFRAGAASEDGVSFARGSLAGRRVQFAGAKVAICLALLRGDGCEGGGVGGVLGADVASEPHTDPFPH